VLDDVGERLGAGVPDGHLDGLRVAVLGRGDRHGDRAPRCEVNERGQTAVTQAGRMEAASDGIEVSLDAVELTDAFPRRRDRSTRRREGSDERPRPVDHRAGPDAEPLLEVAPFHRRCRQESQPGRPHLFDRRCELALELLVALEHPDGRRQSAVVDRDTC
jgi:hypothetical protein